MRLRPANQKLMALPKEAARFASLKASDTVCGGGEGEGGVFISGWLLMGVTRASLWSLCVCCSSDLPVCIFLSSYLQLYRYTLMCVLMHTCGLDVCLFKIFLQAVNTSVYSYVVRIHFLMGTSPHNVNHDVESPKLPQQCVCVCV